MMYFIWYYLMYFSIIIMVPTKIFPLILLSIHLGINKNISITLFSKNIFFILKAKNKLVFIASKIIFRMYLIVIFFKIFLVFVIFKSTFDSNYRKHF